MKQKLILATFAISQVCAAELLKVIPSSKSFEGVNVADSGTLNLHEKAVPLTPVGHGLRNKEVLLVNLKVYVAQLLVSTPELFIRKSAADAALNSLASMQANAIRLSFLRDVSAEKISSSFVDALKANQVNTSAPFISSFLSIIVKGGNAKAGQTLTLASDEVSGILFYEDTAGKIENVQGDAKFLKDVFSIWLGQPADPGLAALKKAIIAE